MFVFEQYRIGIENNIPGSTNKYIGIPIPTIYKIIIWNKTLYMDKMQLKNKHRKVPSGVFKFHFICTQ